MSQKILIVEDTAPLAEAMAKLLARYGFTADVSLDGVAALSRYSETPYDLLIVDLQLPRLSGVEVIRKIRTTHRGKTLPIMIVTGVYKGSEYAARARQSLGIKYYLEKPFKQEEFVAAVKDLLSATADTSLPAAKPAPATAPAATAPAPATTEAPARRLGATERAPERPIAAERVGAHPAGAAASAAPAAAPAPAQSAAAPAGPRQLAEIQPTKAVRGRLKDRPFDAILLDARRNRAVGMLFVKRNGEERRMPFLNGLPADLRSNKPEGSFGAWLFSQGRISLMEYQVYQTQKPTPNPDDILIKMGCLAPANFYAAWRGWLEDSLAQMMGWPDAEFTFQLWPKLPFENEPPAVNLARVIHQGYKKYFPAERAAAIFERSLLKFAALAPGYYDHQMHLEIDPAEAVFLDRADGVKRVREIVPADPAEADKVRRTLWAFVTLGMLELRDQQEARTVAPPFPIRERVTEDRVVPEEEPEEEVVAGPGAPAPAKQEGFDDLIDDLENTLDDIDQVPPEPAKPAPAKPEPVKTAAPAAPAPRAEAKAEARPSAKPSAPAPAAPAEDDQAKRENDLKAFLKDADKKTYYEYFGMKPGQFDFPKLKSEYFRLTKLFSPEHFIMSSGEMLSMAEDALSRVATAYNTLSNVVSKEKYDEMVAQTSKARGQPGSSSKEHDRMQAEVAFQSGMAFLEMEDWDAAEKSLGEAAALAPQNADILANWAYAIFNKNRQSISAVKRAHEIIASALKNKPKCGPAFAYRGLLLLEEGKAALAEADFRKALSINPRNRLALKGLKKLETMKESEKKGLFGRLMK